MVTNLLFNVIIEGRVKEVVYVDLSKAFDKVPLVHLSRRLECTESTG